MREDEATGSLSPAPGKKIHREYGQNIAGPVNYHVVLARKGTQLKAFQAGEFPLKIQK